MLLGVKQSAAKMGDRVDPRDHLLVGARPIAVVMGMTTRTVHRRAAAGLLPCHRIGRRVMFDVAEVAAVLAAQTTKVSEQCSS
jgi:hypothetical protein